MYLKKIENDSKGLLQSALVHMLHDFCPVDDESHMTFAGTLFCYFAIRCSTIKRRPRNGFRSICVEYLTEEQTSFHVDVSSSLVYKDAGNALSVM